MLHIEGKCHGMAVKLVMPPALQIKVAEKYVNRKPIKYLGLYPKICSTHQSCTCLPRQVPEAVA